MQYAPTTQNLWGIQQPKMNPNLSQFFTQNPCPYDFRTSLNNVLAEENENDNGFVALGGDLHPSTLISAYSQGLFPWFNEGEPIAWWSPSPRCVIYPHLFSPSKTLKRTAKSQNWFITFNRNFSDVIHACSEARAYAINSGTATWINPDMISAYTELNKLGFAYSVEVWDANPLEEKAKLIGGLYGLKLGQAFFGESMFHRVTDASKVAFWALMRLCERSNFAWVDCQLPNNHLMSLGAEILPRKVFLADLPKQIFKESCDWTALMGQSFVVKILLDDLPFGILQENQ